MLLITTQQNSALLLLSAQPPLLPCGRGTELTPTYCLLAAFSGLVSCIDY